MLNNRHVLLTNPKSQNPKFNRKRGMASEPVENLEPTPEPKFIENYQKDNLRRNNVAFNTQRRSRNENRTIKFEKSIDLIRIYFHLVFNDDLKSKFYGRYGLSPIEYSHYNKTVIFEIEDERLFSNFEKHIKQVIESPNDTPYNNRPFNLIALILEFEFIDSKKRISEFPIPVKSDILLTLISSANQVSTKQKEILFSFITKEESELVYDSEFPDILEVKNISEDKYKIIADNFDIVRMISSARALTIRPGLYGENRREFGFNVNIPDNLTTVGIIDTGISRIAPFQGLVLETTFNHTYFAARWDEVGHGTLVAGIVIFGDEFQLSVKKEYVAKAKVLEIKALHFDNDNINIPQLLTDIRNAKRVHGIRLFNMSLNIPLSKKYNDKYSQFAFELDKLAYEEDVLLFISVGNFGSKQLEDLLTTEAHPDHDYPTFFYNLNQTSPIHRCEHTNILEPSESLNNISVGALAGNLENGDNTDITGVKEYPAYYTRKFHFDNLQSVNKQLLGRSQKNRHLNKPDLVFEGGDLFSDEAGIEILVSPLADVNKYFGRACGTSLSTPFVASYAAEILNFYPSLKTQTVKALLINCATFCKKKDLPAFNNDTTSLLKRLTGFGRPEKSKLLTTDENSIVFIIEDEIMDKEILTIPINLPGYLKDSDNKLQFNISLCYSFMPVKDNHLNYLPIHMSFNLVKNDIETVAEKGQSEYNLKNGFSWSEDHFGIENRLLSNAQSKSYIFQPDDLKKIGNSIAIGIRCLVKNDIPSNHIAKLPNKMHPFSIALTITELSKNNASNQLYSTMIACNEIRNIAQTDSEAQIDLEM